jgi:hypothetical protein
MERDFMEFCWLVSVFSLTQAKRRGEFHTAVTGRGTQRDRGKKKEERQKEREKEEGN